MRPIYLGTTPIDRRRSTTCAVLGGSRRYANIHNGPKYSQRAHREISAKLLKMVGWPMGFEPTTTGITCRPKCNYVTHLATIFPPLAVYIFC
jgi:hypothetical protein